MDLTIAKNEFLNYVKNYDSSNFQIKRKISHSLRVMELCTQIAKSLNLSDEQIDIATLIGLLHDIARFEQFTKFKTFNDSKSFDHGNFGVEILKKNNYIRKFIEDDKYDDIIFKAIQNHNKFRVDDSLSEQELIFANIIRDADKIDIIYQATCITWTNSVDVIHKIENIKITEQHLNPFIEQRPVNRMLDLPNAEHDLKHLLTMLGFVFDINFGESFKILKEKNYMNIIIDRFDFKDNETRENIEKIRKIVNEKIINN